MTRTDELISRALGTLPPLDALQLAVMIRRGEISEDAVEELLDTADGMRADYRQEAAS